MPTLFLLEHIFTQDLMHGSWAYIVVKQNRNIVLVYVVFHVKHPAFKDGGPLHMVWIFCTHLHAHTVPTWTCIYQTPNAQLPCLFIINVVKEKNTLFGNTTLMLHCICVPTDPPAC